MLESELQIASVAAEFGMLLMLLLEVIRKQTKVSCTNSFVLPIIEYQNTEMVQTSFFLVVGGLVLLVLLFSFYIFPYFICPAVIDDSEQAVLNDPIRGFCSVFK